MLVLTLIKFDMIMVGTGLELLNFMNLPEFLKYVWPFFNIMDEKINGN